MAIEFTQFIFPNGRRTLVEIDRPFEIETMALHLMSLGFKFEIENDNNSIWMSCINHHTEEVVDRICSNGLEVPIKIDEMVTEAFNLFSMKGF